MQTVEEDRYDQALQRERHQAIRLSRLEIDAVRKRVHLGKLTGEIEQEHARFRELQHRRDRDPHGEDEPVVETIDKLKKSKSKLRTLARSKSNTERALLPVMLRGEAAQKEYRDAVRALEEMQQQESPKEHE